MLVNIYHYLCAQKTNRMADYYCKKDLNNMKNALLSLLVVLLMSAVADASAAVRYVKVGATGDGSSWLQASGSIQDMIDASQAGDEVWIAAGTYKPERLLKSNKDRSYAFVLKDGVALYGGFAGHEASLSNRARGERPWEFQSETVLSAENGEPDVWERHLAEGSSYRYTWLADGDNLEVVGTSDNYNHVLYADGVLAQPTVVSGLTLRGACANVWNVKAAGGALYAAGNVQLSECQILENSAYFTAQSTTGASDTYGGAVCLQGTEGAAITDCYFARNYCHSKWGNSWGGAVYAKNTLIARCEFTDCVSLDNGGAVVLVGGTLEDCLFTDCYAATGGAVLNAGTATGNTVYDCRALLGGGIYNQGTASYNLVAGCYADAIEFGAELGGQGGGIYNAGGDIVGSVVYNNKAFAGGGIFISGGRVVNSTIQHNALRQDSEKANVAAAEKIDLAAALCNSIANPDADASNFVSPTHFKGLPSNDDERQSLRQASWALADGSEFIDAGTLTDGISETADIAGNTRIAGSAIDVGAYEHAAQGAAVETIGSDKGAHTTWFTLGAQELNRRPTSGVAIEAVTDAQGHRKTRKVMNR